MSKPDIDEPSPNSENSQQLATAGVVVSSIGLAGWLVMLLIIFTIPKEEYTGDGVRDTITGLGNLLAYLLQVAVGLLGMSINGTLSVVGAIISLSASDQGASSRAQTGLLLGIAGVAIGGIVILWRMAAWGLFSS